MKILDDMKSIFPSEMLNSSQEAMTLESIASKLVWFEEMLHLVHFQSSGYAEHQAVGEAYDCLHGFRDGLIEKIMGYTGRKIGGYKIDPITTSSAFTIASDIMSFASSLKQYAENNGYLDIGSLSDELSGEMAKLKYLLTLS